MTDAFDLSRELSEESLDELAFGVEAGFESQGWDVAATLLAVIDPLTLSIEAIGEGIDLEAEVGGTGEIVLAASPLKSLQGHPHTALVGETVPDWSLGVVLVTEMWTHPEGTPPEIQEITLPQDYDQPGEKRVCVCVMRDGRTRWVERYRGRNPQQKAWDADDERLTETLQRILGQSTAPPQEPIGRLAGRIWLEAAIARGSAAFKEGGAVLWDGESLLANGMAMVLDDSDEEFQSLLQSGWEGLRLSAAAGRVRGIEPEEAEWMDEGMFARAVLRGTRDEKSLLEALEIITDEETTRQVGSRLRELGWLWDAGH